MLQDHKRFVDGVTSDFSKNNQLMMQRISELNDQGIDTARLITSVMGLSGESGETIDLVKKVLFHGKPWTEEIRKKLIDEASDVAWYWQNLCMALGVEPEDVLAHNIEKLKDRYPGGFSVYRSENRNIDIGNENVSGC